MSVVVNKTSSACCCYYYVTIFSIIINTMNVKLKECIYHPADWSLHASSLQISCAENSHTQVTEILRNLAHCYCLVTSGNRDYWKSFAIK